jgi:hypothetical protein
MANEPEQQVNHKMSRGVHPGILVSDNSFILSMANSISLALFVDEMIHIIAIPNKLHFANEAIIAQEPEPRALTCTE